MELRHKQPCSNCPFRRDSLPGFLGGTHLDDWLEAWRVNGPFPCHLTVKDELLARHPRAALDSAAACAGALITRVNAGESVDLPPDHQLVFTSIGEFEKHHAINRIAMVRAVRTGEDGVEL